MKAIHVEVPFGAQKLIIETGKLAKQANGAVLVTCGGTTVLVAACMSRNIREGIDFFPLMVEYQEKTYAAGRIPGGFFKREGRPTQKEILSSRLIDRPIRPLFPSGMYNEVVVTANVISSDGENDSDVLAIIGASAALTISDIPFAGPIGAVRVGLVDGEFVLNPTFEQREMSSVDLVMAGPEAGVVMIEGEASEVPESKLVEALKFGSKTLAAVIAAQKDLHKQIGKKKTEVNLIPPNEKLSKKVKELALPKLTKAYAIADKLARQEAVAQVSDELTADLSAYDDCKRSDEETITAGQVKTFVGEVEYEVVRGLIFDKNLRADGRAPEDIREITCEVDVLPRTHGSSLFTRGQTQAMAVITLGTKRDEQMIESLEGTTYQNFLLHYNFPSFSVGEARGSRGPGRREIGHGALAAKALKAVLPSKEDFPYTIRVVSEILESNGSSSMASVCGGALSLMSAGVPIKSPVAGISIGLVSDGKKTVLLTDIMGLEDHYGDMDFKVAGTSNGVTAIQLDLKIPEVSIDLLAKAFEQAKTARMFILDKMKAVIDQPRSQLSEYAPKILRCKVPEDKIGAVIGPGGKTIKRIMEDTGATSIDIDEEGNVLVGGIDLAAVEKAVDFITRMMEEPVVGKIYDAKVVKLMNFGAFCEFLPGKEGLVHISELGDGYVKNVEDVVKIGDRFKVKLVEIDKMKRCNLSKKQAAQA